MAKGDRWPPVYDADDLKAQITALTSHSGVATQFYEWRLDRSTEMLRDVCQGDVLALEAALPHLDEAGNPAVVDASGFWLAIGNSCDYDREDERWTQIVPLRKFGSTIPATLKAALRGYTQSRVFYVPPWKSNAEAVDEHYVADFMSPVSVDKRAFAEHAVVMARVSRAAWILLNASLVRFLARDDGRNDT